MKFILREGLKKLKNYKKLTFATFLTSTISYLVLGLFLLITISLVESFNVFQENETKMVVFVESSTNEEGIENINRKMKILDGLRNIEYISNKEGLINLQKNFNEQEIINELKDDNPLPHTYILGFENKSYADIAYKVIETFEHIEKIDYEKEYLSEISNTLNNFKFALFAIVLGLLLSSIFFIVIVISLSIHNQRQNIKIMLLTGAPIKYISKPFVIQGLFISALSSTISSLITLYLCDEYLIVLEKIFPFIKTISSTSYNYIPVIIVSVGILLGILGSTIAAKVEIKKVIKNM